MDGPDKLFIEIGGVPVLARAVSAFAGCGQIDELVVAVRRDSLERAAELCAGYARGKSVKLVEGGDTRLRSVYNGVFAASKNSGMIAVHDGARPFISAELIERSITAARAHGAAAPAIPVVSTVKTVEGGVIKGTVERKDMYEMQTPQVFESGMIKAALTDALKKSLSVTDDCMAVEAMGFPIHIVRGDRCNIKITTPEDAAIADAMAAAGVMYGGARR
jgi:2-C-methyl-D-erythritol 4-phosphate cytidylyltransferase